MNPRGLAGPLLLVALFAGLAIATWRRSGDALIDFPRHAFTAWRLSEGDLLYRDVFCIYGPWPHLIETVGFRLFGPGLDVVLILNLVVLVVCCVLYYQLVKMAGGKGAAWVATACFIALSGFNLTGPLSSNYNFVTPYCGQAIWGFLGLLLVVRGLSGGASLAWSVVTGAGAALAWLNKPEFVLATAAVGLVALAWVWCRIRPRYRDASAGLGRKLGRWLLGATCGFLLVVMPLVLWFGFRGGAGHAWEAFAAVPNTVLAPSYRLAMSQSLFNQEVLGLDRVGANLAATLLTGFFLLLLVYWLGHANHLRPPGKPAAGAAGLLAAATTPWLHPEVGGMALVVPILFLAVLSTKECLRCAVIDQRGGNRLPLALLAVAGASMLLRMGLSANLQHYGFFMAPLAIGALMAWVVPKGGWQGAVFSGLVLGLAFSAAGGTLIEARKKNLEVGSGRDRFLSYPLHICGSGAFLQEMLRQVACLPARPETLLGLPESAALNYHARIRNPTPVMEWNPDHLAVHGDDRLLEMLRSHPPEAVVLFGRDLSQYGAKRFGQDKRSGLHVLHWLQENYIPVESRDWNPLAPAERGVATFSPRP